MKKMKMSPVLIAVIVVLVLALGAGAYFLMGSKKSSTGVMQGENAFTSIRDALSKSISLECEIKDGQGRTTKAFIKNGAVRADMTDPDPKNSGSVIMKDKKIWIWNGKEGFTMDVPENTNAEGSANPQANQGDQLLNDLENYKNDCKPSVVSDSLFAAPADVTFQDTSKMMNGSGAPSEEDIKKMMDQYNKSGN